MRRIIYGHDYKSPSNFARNLLIGVAALILLFAFVWTTYDPKTIRLLSGVRPDVKRIEPAVPQSLDAIQRNAVRDNHAQR